MEQLVVQFRQYRRGMWRFRWPGIIAAWVAAVVGVVWIAMQPNQYEASARVFVDTQSILRPLMAGMAVQPNVDQQVALLSRTLLSRPNLEKLARATDLDLGAKSRAAQDAVIDNLARSVQIRNTGRDNLYTLSFSHSDKQKAQQLVQTLLNIFVESGLGRSKKDTESAKRFIDEQIKSFEGKLSEAENRRKEFRIKNLDRQSPDGKEAGVRLSESAVDLETARLQLREAENARDEARRQLQELRLGAGSSTQSLLAESEMNLATPELDSRIDAQLKALDALLLRYTEAHPDVVNGRKLLRSLEEQRRVQVAELRRRALAAPLPSLSAANPAVTELNRVLANSEVQVASLRARVAEYSSRVAQARTLLKVNPEIEAQALALDRDYAINKKAYEDLLARRQSANMSGELDGAGSAEFRVIDPPRASTEPISPKRPLLVGAALVIALGAGLGLSLLLAELRPVFDEGSQLAQATGLPLLGVVSATFDAQALRHARRDTLRFVGASSGLAGFFALSAGLMFFLSNRAG
jgi:polysaccharide chain length determinant protein (PEP-CTERM system associated)